MNTKGDVGRYRSQITGVDISPDSRWLAVLNYQQIIFYSLTNGKLPKKLFPKQTLDLPWLPQAEAIAYSMDGNSLFVASEQSPAPLIRFDRIIAKWFLANYLLLYISIISLWAISFKMILFWKLNLRIFDANSRRILFN